MTLEMTPTIPYLLRFICPWNLLLDYWLTWFSASVQQSGLAVGTGLSLTLITHYHYLLTCWAKSAPQCELLHIVYLTRTWDQPPLIRQSLHAQSHKLQDTKCCQCQHADWEAVEKWTGWMTPWSHTNTRANGRISCSSHAQTKKTYRNSNGNVSYLKFPSFMIIS